MNESVFRSGLVIPLIFVLLLVCQFTDVVKAQAPLSLREIQTAMATKLPNRSIKTKQELENFIISKLKTRGFNEAFDSRVQQVLQRAGASQTLIASVKEFAAVSMPYLIFNETTGQVTGFRFARPEYDTMPCQDPFSLTGPLDLHVDEDRFALSVGNDSGFVSVPESLPEIFKISLQSDLLTKNRRVTVWYKLCSSFATPMPQYLIGRDDPRAKSGPLTASNLFLRTDPISDLKRLEQLRDAINQKTDEVADRVYRGLGSNQKGEFETTQQYEKRMNDLRAKRSVLNRQLIREVYLEAQSTIAEFVMLSSAYYIFPVKARLLQYNADNEVFEIELEKEHRVSISIPLRDAPKFKAQFVGKAYVVAYLSYDEEKPKICLGAIWYEDKETRDEIERYGCADFDPSKPILKQL